MHVLNATGAYLFKVNHEYDRIICGIYSKLTVKTLEQSQLTPLRYFLKLIGLRSSHLRCSIKKAVLKYFAIFTGKHLCLEPVFDKVAGFQGRNFIERDSNIGAFL